MRHLDLFSGIGGFSLAAQWVWEKDHEIVAFCEIDKFCQKVLKKHWPNVPIIEDVKQCDTSLYKNIDLITGGFPCQDISVANTSGNGLHGERSRLFYEMVRIICEIRPRYCLLENSSNLLTRGIDEVLRALAQIGYNAEWHCIPASYVGANHIRDRIWIVADSKCVGWKQRPIVKNRGGNRRTHGKFDNSSKNVLRLGNWELEPELGRMTNGIPNRSHRPLLSR